jgi:hypothetical protein
MNVDPQIGQRKRPGSSFSERATLNPTTTIFSILSGKDSLCRYWKLSI